MNEHERIKNVRKRLKLTQREFGKKLGVQDTAISKLEAGERNLTEQMILSICRTFDVNEGWLRTGEGNMFEETDDAVLAAVVEEYNLDELSKRILGAYVNLTSEQREGANKFLKALSQAVLEENIEKARSGALEAAADVIAHKDVPAHLKQALYGNIGATFNQAFPYIGIGNIDGEFSSEIEEILYDEIFDEELTEEAYMELARQRFRASKKGNASYSILESQEA